MDPRVSIQFTCKNLSGEEKKYFLIPLKRKKAAYVAHTFLQTILQGLSKAAKTDDKVAGQSAALEVLGGIEFETLWSIASILLKNAEIRQGEGKPIVQIDDLDDCDYFEENPDELYLAVYHGIMGNYPKVFTKVRGLLKGFGQGLPDKAEDSTPEK